MQFTPTVEHCSMATLIGLCIRVKLLRALPPRFKVRQRAPSLASGCLLDGLLQHAWPQLLCCCPSVAATRPLLWDAAAAAQADILLSPGSHASEAAVNKQLSDKERVAAALENPNLTQARLPAACCCTGAHAAACLSAGMEDWAASLQH